MSIFSSLCCFSIYRTLYHKYFCCSQCLNILYNINMKLLSWNVNGLRAVAKKGALSAIFEIDPDIICLQETKAHPEQLTDEVRSPAGYFSYFDHSKVRKGYSGVAIFSKVEPEKIEYGIGIPKFDDEGRTLVAYYKDFVLLNVYFPNGGGGPHRLEYKMHYYDEFLKFIQKLEKKGKKVIFFWGLYDFY